MVINVLFLIWGMSLGSFLNVIIYRIPRGFLVSLPRRSYCIGCSKKIPWYENIPVLGYLFIRGRCTTCKTSIDLRHPVIEFMTGILVFAVYAQMGLTLDVLYYVAFALSLLAVTFIDLEFRIIPDRISKPMIVLGLLGSFFVNQNTPFQSFLGAAIGWFSFWAMAKAYEKIKGIEGLGYGDVKLLALIGAFLGYKALLGVILISSIAGSVIGLLVIIFARGNLKTAVPYGPFLSFAALVMLFWGEVINKFLYPSV